MENEGDRMEIKIKAENYKVIPIDKVRPNPWNPKDKETEEYNKIKKSIKTRGLREAISVRNNNGYEILDGEQRWRACKDLGFKNILVYDWGKIDDQMAKEETIWKEVQVPFNEVKLAELVSKMMEEYKNVNLPYSPEELENYKNMTEFDWDKYNEDSELDSEIRTINVRVTLEQYEIIMKALDTCQKETNSNEGRALELICADYLAGVKNEVQRDNG